MQNENLNFEIKRKNFHLYGLIFPLVYSFILKTSMNVLLLILTGFTLYADISRNHNQKIKEVVDKFFSKFLRNKERTGFYKLSGASYMALGLLISCLFFSKGLVITSWLILIISDCIAALVGMKYMPLKNGKSLVGSGAFFISSVFISTVIYFFFSHPTSFIIIIFCSLMATLAEFYAGQINK